MILKTITMLLIKLLAIGGITIHKEFNQFHWIVRQNTCHEDSVQVTADYPATLNMLLSMAATGLLI